jgi:hypothetical protein
MPSSLWSFWKRTLRGRRAGRRANPRPRRRLTLEWLESRSLLSAATLTTATAPAVTAETLVASAASVAVGSPTTFTLVVPDGGSAAGDTYDFFMDGSTDLGTATVDGNGVATLTAVLPAGTHIITAVCPGGTVSPPVTVIATLPPDPVITPPVQPVTTPPVTPTLPETPLAPTIPDRGPALPAPTTDSTDLPAPALPDDLPAPVLLPGESPDSVVRGDTPASVLPGDLPAPVLLPGNSPALVPDPPPDLGGSTAGGLLVPPAADTPVVSAGENVEAPTGIPSEPSPVGVLESTSGPEPNAGGVGEDVFFGYATADEQFPSEDIQLPPPAVADTPAETTVAPSEAPLTVTVELGADFLPAGKPAQVGTDPDPSPPPSTGDPEEGGAPRDPTPAAIDQAPPPPGNGPASLGAPRRVRPGDEGDAAVEPEIQERLRRLKLDRPMEERGADDLQSFLPAPAPHDPSDIAPGPGQDQDREQPPGPDAGATPGAPSDPWALVWPAVPATAGGPEGGAWLPGPAGAKRAPGAEPATGLPPCGWDWSPALLAALAAPALTAGAEGPARTVGTARDRDGRPRRPRRAGC